MEKLKPKNLIQKSEIVGNGIKSAYKNIVNLFCENDEKLKQTPADRNFVF